MAIMRSDDGKSIYPSLARNFVSESTLTGGGIASVLDVFGTLGHIGNRGYIANDATTAGLSFTVQITYEGTNYDTAFTLLAGEKFDLTGVGVNKIKLTPGASNTAYRVNVW